MSVALRGALQVVWLWALNIPSYFLFVDELRIRRDFAAAFRHRELPPRIAALLRSAARAAQSQERSPQGILGLRRGGLGAILSSAFTRKRVHAFQGE